MISRLKLIALLLPAFAVSAEEDLLFFPASKIEAETQYQYLQGSEINKEVMRYVDEERLKTTLLSLLEQPSKSCQENDIAVKARDLLLNAGKDLGIKVQIDDLPAKLEKLTPELRRKYNCNSGTVSPSSGNVIAHIPGTIPAPTWNLSFHLDTNQLSFSGFRVEGDTIYPPDNSPLGADDKAGITIIAEILNILSTARIPHGEIRIVGLVAEEDSAAGAKLVNKDAFTGDVFVSIDGTNPDEIGRAAPTMYSGYITVKTKTSHPASVDKKQSVSACAVGAEILTKNGFRPDAHPAGLPNVVLHSYFTSCGIDNALITPKGEPQAEYKFNTIAPFWTAAWQMRSLESLADTRHLVEQIKSRTAEICGSAGKDRSPVECKITGTSEPKLLGYVAPLESPSVRLLQKGFTLTGEKPVKVTEKQFGGFNGNYIKSRFDEEMLIVGTGANQIHTNEETVSIKGMARVVRGVLASMLVSYQYRKKK